MRVVCGAGTATDMELMRGSLTDSLARKEPPPPRPSEVLLEEVDENGNPELGLPPLHERTYLITGATSGIGRWTSELLARKGCTVLIHGRKAGNVEAHLKSLMSMTAKQGIECRLDGFVSDLKSQPDVEEFAQMVKERHPKIHGILHNAACINGYYTGEKVITWEQHELTLAVNVLAPFMLTNALMDNVRASGAGRILFSGSRNMGGVQFLDDLEFKTKWHGRHAYKVTKLMAAMVAQELHDRYGEAPRLCFHNIDPGVAETRLMRAAMAWSRSPTRGSGLLDTKSGTLPLVTTAVESFKALIEDRFQETSGFNLEEAPKAVYNKERRERLWDRLVELTGTEWPEPQAPGAAAPPPGLPAKEAKAPAPEASVRDLLL